jgi:hypothetical protein
VQDFCVANYWKNLTKMEGLADKMKPDCNKRVEFNCELNFQWYFCLEFGLLIRRYVNMSLQRNNKFGKLVFLVWNYLVLLAEEPWPVVAG